MSVYAKLFSKLRAPQWEPIPGTVPNSAGGYAFKVKKDCVSILVWLMIP
jgi:60 kDa SS-A/Ro ribonucleoprotein